MLARNPSRMDYQQKYEEIVDDYNREKDRVNIEKTFHRLMELMDELDAEQKRAIAEGLNEDELALFDLLKKDDLAKAERERVKQASRSLLASIKARLSELDRFWEKEQTKADVEVFILTRCTLACRRRHSPPRRRRRSRPRSMPMSGNRPSAVNLRGWRNELGADPAWRCRMGPGTARADQDGTLASFLIRTYLISG